jgi:hypothetical protein
LLGLLIGLYLLMNVCLVTFVPILHKVSLEITILDNASELPLQEVDISWLETNPTTGFQWTTPVGVTDEKGHLENEMTIQEQPLWVYPIVGWFKFDNRTLRLTKTAYDEKTVDLSKETPTTSYRNSAVSITVKMNASRAR